MNATAARKIDLELSIFLAKPDLNQLPGEKDREWVQEDGGHSADWGEERRRFESFRSQCVPLPGNLKPSCSSVCEDGLDGGLHGFLLTALRLCLCPAVAGTALPAQALQLQDSIPLPVPAVGGTACPALLLLLQGLCDSQCSWALRLLAALLLPGVPAVFHTQPDEPLLCTGESPSNEGRTFL